MKFEFFIDKINFKIKNAKKKNLIYKFFFNIF